MKLQYFLYGILMLYGCNDYKLEKVVKRSHPSHNYTYIEIDTSSLNYVETDYVPVYSDIYHLDGTKRFLLTTTISIRNTSLSDSAFVLSATYHDSYGTLLKEYVNSIILLSPLESIEFVVEENENLGGAGANFTIKWGAVKFADQLLIQSIMIGTSGQQGLSFLSGAKVIQTRSKINKQIIAQP